MDLNNVSNGEFSVQKVKILRITMTVISLNVSQMSLCSDYTEGGAEVMVFTNKINFSRSNFYADFFQLNDEDNEESKIWRSRVVIQETQLHTVGQHLGRQLGHVRPEISNFNISTFRRPLIQCPHVRQERASHPRAARQSSLLLLPAGENHQDQHSSGTSIKTGFQLLWCYNFRIVGEDRQAPVYLQGSKSPETSEKVNG